MRVSRWIMPAALLGLSGLSATVALADEKKLDVDDLPKAVLKAAKKAYPEAKIVGASKETEDGETIYEVEMKLDGKSIDLAIDDEGEIEAVEKEIEVEDLPKAVIKAAAKKFPKGKITKAEEVTGEDDKVVYEVAITVGEKKPVEVVMAPNGKILESEDEDDEKEESKAKKKDKDDDDDKGKAKKKDKDDDDDKGKAKKKDKDDDEDDKGQKDKDGDEKGERKEKPKS